MDGYDGATLIWGLVMIMLVASSIVAQRIPIGQFVRYLLIWALIGSTVYGLVLFRSEIGEVGDRARADLGGGRAASVRGETSVIRQSDDGHFWVDARVGERSVEFLIDSGATTTALNFETAEALGLDSQWSDQQLAGTAACGDSRQCHGRAITGSGLGRSRLDKPARNELAQPLRVMASPR
jgi:predicted aspartyl protease